MLRRLRHHRSHRSLSSGGGVLLLQLQRAADRRERRLDLRELRGELLPLPVLLLRLLLELCGCCTRLQAFDCMKLSMAREQDDWARLPAATRRVIHAAADSNCCRCSCSCS